MAEPIILDVRSGLTPVAIAELRQARRVVVSLRGGGSAATLELSATDQRSESATTLLISAFWLGPTEAEPRGPLDLLGPARGGPWEQIAGEVQVGDRLTLIDRDRRGAWLRRDRVSELGATYPLSSRGGRWRPPANQA